MPTFETLVDPTGQINPFKDEIGYVYQAVQLLALFVSSDRPVPRVVVHEQRLLEPLGGRSVLPRFDVDGTLDARKIPSQEDVVSTITHDESGIKRAVIPSLSAEHLQQVFHVDKWSVSRQKKRRLLIPVMIALSAQAEDLELSTGYTWSTIEETVEKAVGHSRRRHPAGSATPSRAEDPFLKVILEPLLKSEIKFIPWAELSNSL